jgi:hypothetical protein
MSVTINRELADVYFGPSNHLQNKIWDAFTTGQKDAGIAHAQRELERHTGITAFENESVNDTSKYYPDRAVYEQALHMLTSMQHTANGEQSGPKWPTVMLNGEPSDHSDVTIAKKAMEWLLVRQGGSIRIARG